MANTTHNSIELTGVPVHSRYDLSVGDRLAVFDASDVDVKIDLATGEGHRAPMKLIAWVAINEYKQGISGVADGGSYDTSYFNGEWQSVGSNERISVQVRAGNNRMETYAPQLDFEARRRCQVFGWHVVAKVVKNTE